MDLAVNPPERLTTLTTVLIIDDNDGDRRYWCEALKHSVHHYTVLEAQRDSWVSIFADLNGLIVSS